MPRGIRVEIGETVVKTSENFPVASLLIRRDLRADVLCFYAFARAADDIADDPGLGPAEKLARLARCDAGLDGASDGAPEALALHAALSPKPSCLLDHARALLTAFRQDSRGHVHATDDDLLDYCRHSAVPVGRFLLDLHGEDASSHGPSDALCTALQILNHLQDISADKVRLERVYLPSDRLTSEGVGAQDLVASRSSAGLRRVIDGLLDLCDRLLAQAAPLPDRIAARGLAGEAATILWLAQDLSCRLRRQDPLAGRVEPTPLCFVRAGLAGAGRALWPLRRPIASAGMPGR